MASLRTIVVFLMILNSVKCFEKKYYNYTLYRSVPVNENQLTFFKGLDTMYDVNYWRSPGQVNKTVEFIISPDDEELLLKEAKERHIILMTIMKDVQRVFDMQIIKPYIRRRMDLYDWQSYFKTDDIYTWLNDLSYKYPDEVHLESIGKTYQNRDILAVTIILKKSRRRSRVIIEGGIHAREWIAPAFVTYMIQQIANASNSENKALKEVAETYEWYFVPLLNPDGYEISHTSDRLWRKNGRGVDLNRNFASSFGTVGVSFNRWDETYCGESAFSESESSAMANFVRSKSANLEYYLAFHSYGQYMIIPYAYSTTHLDNFDRVRQMCRRSALKIADKRGTSYTIGTAYDTVGYVTSGVSGCWVKKTFKVPYVVTFELRDEGYYGFALPAKEILPTSEETLDGVVELLSDETRKRNSKRPSVKSGQEYIFDGFVIVWNIFLFILVRYY